MLKKIGSAPFLQLSAGGNRVTFPTEGLRMVLPVENLLRVPRMRPGVAGVIIRQHRVIPVFALAALLPTEVGETARPVVATAIVVVEQEGALAGLLVESTEPSSLNPVDADGISDGIRLLASAGIFNDPPGDEPAAHAASGAI